MVKPEILQRAVRLVVQDLDVFSERVASALRHIPGVIDARATADILVGRSLRDFRAVEAAVAQPKSTSS